MRYHPEYTFYRPILTSAEKSQLHTIAEQNPFEAFKNSIRSYEEITVDFVYTSAKIEGNTYDRIDTDNLIRLGITAGGKRYSDAVMLLNLRDGFEQVMQSNEKTVIDADYVADLHKVLMKDLLPASEQGLARTSGVKIGASLYTPPEDPTQLRTEFKSILAEAQKYQDPFERSIYLHCNLAYLQYFRDGNKRTARMVQTAALAKSQTMPLLFDERLIGDYQRAVVHYYESGEYAPYVSFFQKNYALTAEKLYNHPTIILNPEAQQRIDFIPMITGGSRPETVFRDLALAALKELKPEYINWLELERKTAVKAIGELGYSPNGVVEAIGRYSPSCLTEEAKQYLASDVRRMTPDLQAQYQRTKEQRTNDEKQERGRS